MSTASALGRFVDPIASILTPEVADKLVRLRADDELQARLDELAEKCNEGQLTDKERREYDDYIAAIDFISLLQAKARALLDHKAAG
jgi:hypothetical protein